MKGNNCVTLSASFRVELSNRLKSQNFEDREGENIGFEVIALCKEFFDETKIHRAIFSALTKDEVKGVHKR